MSRLAGLRRTLEVSIASAIVAALTFAYLLAAGRAFAPDVYADFATAYAFFTFFAVAISPIAPMTARILARYCIRREESRMRDTHAALRRVLIRAVFVLGVPAGLLVIPVAHALHFRSPSTLLLALASSLIFTFVNFERGVLQGTGRMRWYSWNVLLEAGVRLAIAMVILGFRPSPAGAFSAHVLALVIALLMLPHSQSSPVEVQTAVEWSEVRRLAGPLCVAMLGMAVFQNMDVFLIKRTTEARDAGWFGAAAVIGRSIGVLAVAIYVLAGPNLAETHERGESVRAATIGWAIVFLALAVVPVSLLLVWGDDVIEFLYGSLFRPAGEWVGSLALLSVITSLHLILGQGLITIHDRLFVPLYLLAAAAQTVALYFGRSIPAFIHAQFAIQGILLILMIILVIRVRPERS